MPSIDRLIYVVDSGSPQSGFAVFGWIQIMPDRSSTVLGSWLEHRKRLWRNLGIPVTKELHMTEYVNGRARIAERVPDRHVHAGTAFWKDFGREVARESLQVLRCCEGLQIGSVCRWSRDRTGHNSRPIPTRPWSLGSKPTSSPTTRSV